MVKNLLMKRLDKNIYFKYSTGFDLISATIIAILFSWMGIYSNTELSIKNLSSIDSIENIRTSIISISSFFFGFSLTAYTILISEFQNKGRIRKSRRKIINKFVLSKAVESAVFINLCAVCYCLISYFFTTVKEEVIFKHLFYLSIAIVFPTIRLLLLIPIDLSKK